MQRDSLKDLVTKVVVMAEISLNQREVVAMAARRNFILYSFLYLFPVFHFL
jgi:hypothetical protein